MVLINRFGRQPNWRLAWNEPQSHPKQKKWQWFRLRREKYRAMNPQLVGHQRPSFSAFLLCNITSLTLSLCVSSYNGPAFAAVFMLDLLSSAEIERLKNGNAYVRMRRGPFLPPETDLLHQRAGQAAEKQRKADAVLGMVVSAENYEANGILFLREFPAGQLDWKENASKITLIDTMPQIAAAYNNALTVTVMSLAIIDEVRTSVQNEVDALYIGQGKGTGGSGAEIENTVTAAARAGLYLLREMATKLRFKTRVFAVT